jgi:site-specific recombinase XerD
MKKPGRKAYGYRAKEREIIERIVRKRRPRKGGLVVSYCQIAQELNDEGYRTRTGKPWYPIAVGRIIAKGLEYYQKLHDRKEPEEVKKKQVKKEYLDSNDYLTAEEVATCRAVLADSDRVIFEVLIGSGLRASECCGLEVRDIGIYARKSQIDVRLGKGAKRRSVIIGPRLKGVLTDYLEERPALKLATWAPLFINRRSKQLTYWDLYSRIRKIRERSGVKCLHPHALRHTFGTYLYNYKKDLEYVREQLGHSNINTTRIYAKTLSIEKIEQMEGYEKSFDP